MIGEDVLVVNDVGVEMYIMVLVCMEIRGGGDLPAAGAFNIVPMDNMLEDAPSANVFPTPKARTLDGVLQHSAPLPSSQQKVPALGSPHGITADCLFGLTTFVSLHSQNFGMKIRTSPTEGRTTRPEAGIQT